MKVLRRSDYADELELKVLPTQPDHPAIPEEEGDDEDAHERVKADDDESEGVEVRLSHVCRQRAILMLVLVLHSHLADPSWNGST